MVVRFARMLRKSGFSATILPKRKSSSSKRSSVPSASADAACASTANHSIASDRSKGEDQRDATIECNKSTVAGPTCFEIN